MKPDCVHDGGFTVNRDERDVRCVRCGAVLDPIAVLADLETLVEQFDRERRSLDAERTRMRERQAYAIEQKRKKQLRAARAHCQCCGGTGWVPGANGVVVCACRRAVTVRG